MSMQNRYPQLRHLDFLLADMLALLLSFSAAFWLKLGGLWFLPDPEWSAGMCVRIVLLFLAADALMTVLLDPYSGILRRKFYMEIFGALRLTAANAIAVALMLYIFKIGEQLSRTIFVLTFVFYFILSLLLKYILKKLIVSGKLRLGGNRTVPLCIITDRAHADAVIRDVTAGDYSPYEIRAIHFPGTERAAAYQDIPVLGRDFAAEIIRQRICDVLIALPPAALPQADYRMLIDNAVNVHISLEAILGIETEDQYVSDLGVCKALSMTAFSFRLPQLFYLGVKRLLDVLFGLLGLVLLLPVSAAVKIAYLLHGDRAPIFYTQMRVGRNGKPIRIWKYRTMVPDAEARLSELLKDERYRAEWERSQKLRHDPRITRTGQLLRKTSVDELPQVINLLRGDMSLVGPRPLVEGELEAHGGLQLYQRVRPGITGWWACNGRSNIGYRERLELEYYYIKHFSVYLDALCVLRTVFAVLKKDGAE
ncbi:MAG: sugar transferase [Oscillospiraceae bacterium]|nr:sugar transferase [Oscillospiraceae bacterium]